MGLLSGRTQAANFTFNYELLIRCFDYRSAQDFELFALAIFRSIKMASAIPGKPF